MNGIVPFGLREFPHQQRLTVSIVDGSEVSSSQGSLDIGACCLCHCALDYSDKAAFDRQDRHSDYHSDSDQDEYFFRPNDPYLPMELHDPHNALVYCDGCDRMYHQKCHFVPVLFVPRGTWTCLVCQSLKKQQSFNKMTNPKNVQKHSAPKQPQQKLKQQKVQKLHQQTQHLDLQHIFHSPPQPQAHTLEKLWERQSQPLKQKAWKEQLDRAAKAIQHQYSNVRQATMTIDTLTSTRANRELFDHKSQQLAQSILTQFAAKYQCRQILTNLESIIVADPRQPWNTLLQWVRRNQQKHTEFIERVLFPFGNHHKRRWECRTPEMDRLDDGSISVDALVCNWCHDNHASDENDLVMCDGEHCFRAFHFQCVNLTLAEAEQQEDWFCPLCQGLATLMHQVQSLEEGDEWESRRFVKALDEQSYGSVASWDNIQEALPTAESDYEFAKEFAQGKRTPAIHQWLSDVIGMTYDVDEDDEDESFGEASMGSDDTEDSEQSAGSHSGEELEISPDELAALSDASGDDDDNSSLASRRRSRRSSTRSKGTNSDIGMLDEANIMQGRRSRPQVDYQKLNDTLFGDQQDSAEDEDEFESKSMSERDSNEDSSSSDSGSSSDDEGDVSSLSSKLAASDQQNTNSTGMHDRNGTSIIKEEKASPNNGCRKRSNSCLGQVEQNGRDNRPHVSTLASTRRRRTKT